MQNTNDAHSISTHQIASLIAVLLSWPSLVSAAAIDTFEVTINALDSTTGAVIQTESVVAPFQKTGSWAPTGSVDVDVPENKKFFAWGNMEGPGSGHRVRLGVRCSTGGTCGGQDPAPGEISILFEGAESYTAVGAGGVYNIIALNLDVTITSIDSGNTLSTSEDTLDFSASDASLLAGRNCAVFGAACQFRIDWISQPGVLSAVYSGRRTPEPTTAVLLLGGLVVLSGRASRIMAGD